MSALHVIRLLLKGGLSETVKGVGGGGGAIIISVMKMITNTKSLPMHSVHYAKSLKSGIFPRAKSPVC